MEMTILGKTGRYDMQGRERKNASTGMSRLAFILRSYTPKDVPCGLFPFFLVGTILLAQEGETPGYSQNCWDRILISSDNNGILAPPEMKNASLISSPSS